MIGQLSDLAIEWHDPVVLILNFYLKYHCKDLLADLFHIKNFRSLSAVFLVLIDRMDSI